MIAITIAELSKEILNKIEEMPCSKKYKDSLRCQGVRRIQQYFNDLGQDIFCPKLLAQYVAEVNEKYRSGAASKCHWQRIYRCSRIAYEISATDMARFYSPAWSIQVLKNELQLFDSEPLDRNDIRSLIVHTMQNALYENDYSEKTRMNYAYDGFYAVLRFFMKHETTIYSESLLRKMLDDEYSRYRQGELDSSTFHARRKIIEWIVEFHNHGIVSRKYLAPFSYTFASASYENLLEEYQSYIRANEYLKESSLWVYVLRMRQFFKKAEYDGRDCYEKLDLPYIVRYITEYGKRAPRGVHSFFNAFRSFSRFLQERKPELPILTDALIGSPAQHKKVYNGYTQVEAETILNSIDRSSLIGKRDYAIIMLAYSTGLRAVDIANLTLRDIDWKRCEIRICQSKTAVPLALPMDINTGNAIANYILHARPDADTPYIFLRADRSFDRINNRSISSLVRKYAVQVLGGTCHKKHGIHSFRRGIGARMLNTGIPVQTIQDVLGHSTAYALPQYTAVALERLRLCVPAFSDVPVMREELR
jgi:site-specific recombinase XerD